MKHLFIALLIFSMGSILFGQELSNPVAPSSAEERIKAFDSAAMPLINTLPFRNIGPSVFSGRISDLAVHPADPSIFYAAYASGGLWKTENHGTSFEPIFDGEQVMTIGDIAVNWESNTIYLGSGEANSSRSSYAGNGVYKSVDDGKTWEHLGLDETHHISRIIIDPQNSETIYVAALGHLYSPNPERGIYKSEDGGATWEKVLFVNENSGAIDLIIDPNNPSELYAATWERTRRAWNFWEAGTGSAIYKSSDKGTSWNKLDGNGLPQPDGMGRIGLTASLDENGKPVLYALIDNYNRRPAVAKDEMVLNKEDLKQMNQESFDQLEDEKLEQFLDDNNFPEKYNLEKVRSMVKENEIEISDLGSYNESANSLLFDTPVIGAEVYASTDGGQNWTKTHDEYIDGLYYSYGYYFGQIRAAAYDHNELYIMGVPILRSLDGGATWENVNGRNVHADHHALWINPDREGHLVNGNDGGVNISYDRGESWTKHNAPSVGQFYYINVDMAEPYNVYGGTQDNGVWKGSKDNEEGVGWQMSGSYPYKKLMGGDGMQVQIDNRDNQTVYTGFQFGNYFRIDPDGSRNYITPKHELGQDAYRWNWQSPILLSSHNQDILYMGSNMLHRSMDQGETFKTISEDLTKGGKKGDVPFGTLSAIDESIFDFGLIYTGSDDGLIQITKDGGKQWELISNDLPQDLWVSRLIASTHQESRVYVSLNGYRWDNFKPYVYCSEDYGKTWKSIHANLQEQAINVIKEDPFDEDILYIGTDHGVYLSLDRGKSYNRFGDDIPNVPIHDIVIHPRDGDLVVGTHGRSIYIADMTPIREISKMLNKELVSFPINDLDWNKNWGSKRNIYSDPREPAIEFKLYSAVSGSIQIDILNHADKVLNSWNQDINAGLNQIEYDGALSDKATKHFKYKKPKLKKSGKYYLLPGAYKVKFRANGEEQLENFKIEED